MGASALKSQGQISSRNNRPQIIETKKAAATQNTNGEQSQTTMTPMPKLYTDVYVPVASPITSPPLTDSTTSRLPSITPPSSKPLIFSQIAAAAEQGLRYQPSPRPLVDHQTRVPARSLKLQERATVQASPEIWVSNVEKSTTPGSPFTRPESQCVHFTLPDLSWGTPDTYLNESRRARSGERKPTCPLCIVRGVHEGTAAFKACERKRGMELMRENRRLFTAEEIQEAKSRKSLTWLAVQTTIFKRQKEANEQAIRYKREYDLSLSDSEAEEEPRRKRICRSKA